MNEWQYRGIRYSPDMARGERLNIGICLFDGKRYYFRFAEPSARIRYLDPLFDDSLFADLRADLEAHADNLAYLEERIAAFDPTFAFSDARTIGSEETPEEALEDLYRQLVEAPLPETSPLT